MTKIEITDDNPNLKKVIETNLHFVYIQDLIQRLVEQEDKNLFLKTLSQKLKDFLLNSFSISLKELQKFFEHKFEGNAFLELMIKHGYIYKYHTSYKLTDEAKQALAHPSNNEAELNMLEEGILFGEILGVYVIKFILNTKNFQKSELAKKGGYDKRMVNDLLNQLISQGYLTKTGTTFCITNKFKIKASEYQELFDESLEIK